ncbi:hypothetical protein EHM92_01995 [bacterium]|nr:MAG: hypothetical protein EHM92_01995 [bacterium]
MRAVHAKAQVPATLLFWTLTDEVIERPEVLERQFHHIRESGFGGVAAFVRCSRYTWHDPLARKALKTIGKLCKQYHIQIWIGPDPRFVSRKLIMPSGGLEVILFGDRARADVFPNLGPVVNGAFSVRCDISPRHVHTLQEVAIEYAPGGIERLYALRMNEDSLTPVEVQDVSPYARLFYNARDHYVEAFGKLPARFQEGEWKALAFFRASTNHVDFADRAQMRRYLEMVGDLKAEGCHADGLMWDEPGFTCTYGTLPFSPGIRKSYERLRGRTVGPELWKLALESEDGSHVRVRAAYYQAIQRVLNEANLRFMREAKRLWGPGTVSGIHDTWHFESADMCDMNHGSLDLWQAGQSKTGGFVDLGGIDKLRDSAAPWNAHLAAMSVICASLGRLSAGRYAYNNLWTVGDDDGQGWQATVMDHCVNTMALFGTRWLAHCYGPVGTIGEESSFLGSPPMPGYPEHSTWPFFPVWNRRLHSHVAAVGQKLPESNVLVLFPVEALYALAGPAADRAANMIFELLLALLDSHYHVDVLSTSACHGALWSRGELVLGDHRYRAVVAPFATAEQSSSLHLSGKKPVFFLHSMAMPDRKRVGGTTTEGLLQWLAYIPGIRPVSAPSGSWTSMTRVREGMVVTLSPSRHGYRYTGNVSLDGETVELLEERGGLTRILFPRSGEPQVLPNSADFSI